MALLQMKMKQGAWCIVSSCNQHLLIQFVASKG